MSQRTRKAKLAHEKQKGTSIEGKAFTPTKIVELVEHAGKAGAVVELDDKGTLGIIDRGFITAGEDGNPAFRQISCPATYDPVAQQKAVARYQAYAQS